MSSKIGSRDTLEKKARLGGDPQPLICAGCEQALLLGGLIFPRSVRGLSKRGSAPAAPQI